jgi:hypothetical protein
VDVQTLRPFSVVTMKYVPDLSRARHGIIASVMSESEAKVLGGSVRWRRELRQIEEENSAFGRIPGK